jgi:hypothetical protein
MEEVVPSTRLIALAAAALGGLCLATPAAAAPVEQHCAVHVIDQEPDGELVLSKPECFRSLDEAMDQGAIADTQAGSTQALAASTVLAVHYDGANFSGSSLTIFGTTCSGGYTNLALIWRNRISSSSNGCPVVRFYDGVNLTGAVETQVGSGNLFTLNNRADSVQYTS